MWAYKDAEGGAIFTAGRQRLRSKKGETAFEIIPRHPTSSFVTGSLLFLTAQRLCFKPVFGFKCGRLLSYKQQLIMHTHDRCLLVHLLPYLVDFLHRFWFFRSHDQLPLSGYAALYSTDDY